MYVHEEARVGWLAHPRTASQATATALMEQAGFVKALPDGRRVREVRGQHHDGAPEGLEGRMEREGGWTVWTTVRNHFDALVSWWHYRNRPETLGAFVRDLPHMHTRYFPDSRRMWAMHGRRADRLVRYERLEPELNVGLAERGLGRVTVPKKNVSEEREHRAYRPYFDAGLRRWVIHWWGEEMAELGYGW